MTKIYKFTCTDTLKRPYSPEWLLKHFKEKVLNDEMIYAYFGIPEYVKELRKLRKKIPNGTKYTYVVFGKKLK